MKDIIKQLLFLDTCTIINLAANSYKDGGEILDRLIELTDSQNFMLVLPEQVKNEWDKNKELKVVKDRIKSFEAKIRNTKDFICEFDQVDKNVIVEILDKYSATVFKKEELLRKNVTRMDLILSRAKIVPSSEFAQIHTIKHGLEKKAPFQNKNSTADAVIFFSCINYLSDLRKTNKNYLAYFVSENKADFCNNSDVRSFHVDLTPYAEEVQLKYIENIGSLINGLLGREAINQEVIETIASGNKIVCPNCNSSFRDKVGGHWGISQYGPGLSWQVTCPECRYNYDTGDFWDE